MACLRFCFKLPAVVILLPLIGVATAEGGRLVNVGDHRLYLNCSGSESGPTVVLEAGQGANSTDWTKVQTLVEKFSRVCSYDRAGSGRSDRPAHQITESAIVKDLHQLLAITDQPRPYLLVGHSLGGIYVRAFASAYPKLVQGIVLVDSAHEEQLNRYTAISAELGEQFALQGGRSSYEQAYDVDGFLRPGEKLTWHTDVPLIVIEHKRPTAKTGRPSATQGDEIGEKVAQAWHDMQVDLARRSSKGQLREAQGGHMIPRHEPELVSQAVEDVLKEMRARSVTQQ